MNSRDRFKREMDHAGGLSIWPTDLIIHESNNFMIGSQVLKMDANTADEFVPENVAVMEDLEIEEEVGN